MKRTAFVLGILAFAALAMATDQQAGTVSNFNQPISGRNQSRQSTALYLSDSGFPSVDFAAGSTVIATGPDGGAVQTISAGSATSAPAPTITTIVGNVTGCTAVGGASCSAIYPSTDWGAVPNLSIAITNNAASAVLSDVLVEWSPIADGGGFELWDSTMFDELGAGVTKSVAISGNSRRYLRIEARGAADGGPIHVSVTGNQN